MESRRITVLIIAAGTGGHVFPALSIATELHARGAKVEWLGTHRGMENRILDGTDFKLHRVSVNGLRGAGLLKILTAPWMLLKAFFESRAVLKDVKPDLVIGMGGFVCGPAGIASKFLGIPLFIHEQNAVPGMTNRILAPLAAEVFEAFPNTFANRSRVRFTGNPLRKAIMHVRKTEGGAEFDERPLRLLVLGGSQGAQAINEVVPEVVANFREDAELEVLHQVGANNLETAETLYQSLGMSPDLDTRVVAFVEDMAEAYQWADLIVCRSGASTVSEVAAVGIPAIFIPYPHHKDQQQTLNAKWLSDAAAAVTLQQSLLTTTSLLEVIRDLAKDRQKLQRMGKKAGSLAITDASTQIVDACLGASNA